MTCSHAQLVMLLNGKRPLRQKHTSFLCKGIRLTSQERLYFQALIQFESSTGVEEKELAALWLADLNPGVDFRSRDIEQFHVLAHWVHSAILAMTELDDFCANETEIARRFGKKVTFSEVRAAIERLKSLDLIKQHSDGGFSATYNRTSTRDDVRNHGAREYHKGVMKLAEDALGDDVENREFQAFAISIDESNLQLAKKMIRKFRHQFSKAMGSPNGTNVYQLNLQFFRLTESLDENHLDEGAGTEYSSRRNK